MPTIYFESYRRAMKGEERKLMLEKNTSSNFYRRLLVLLVGQMFLKGS
jgi:hypothetical protein